MASNIEKLGKLTPSEKKQCGNDWDNTINISLRQTIEWTDENPLLKDRPHADFISNVNYDGHLTYLAAKKYYSDSGNVEKNKCVDIFNAAVLARDFNLSQFLSSELSTIGDSQQHLEKWAAWLTILHADNHIGIQRKYAKVFIRMAQEGHFSGQKAAMLSDRLSNMQKEKQLYGVLYDCVNGNLVQNLDDIEAVNKRRKSINLPSHAIWLREQVKSGACKTK